ncbi:hypothetical protein GGR50DRAFT_17389 [Xylaria sp. CBS 124048]|nr:hypothetical protein GGR50DRAFT_17389 [Xylaria sp. CBS 124048]
MSDPSAAGLRTSNSNPSLRVISNLSGSTRSAAARLGSYRHVLLKSDDSQRQSSIKQELPVPPVITHHQPDPTDNRNSEQIPASRTQTPRVEEPTQSTATPSETDIVIKDASDIGIQSPHEDHGSPHTSCFHVSKVRPAIIDDSENDRRYNSQDEYFSDSSVPVSPAYSTADHFQYNRMRTSKVRPFADFQSVQTSDPHEGHYRTVKVRPYFDSSNVSHTGELQIVEVPGRAGPHGEKRFQKAKKYWGDLPGFKGRRAKQGCGVDQKED